MKKLSLDELNRPDISSYKEERKLPVIVILDNVRSALNVGSFFRTCDAFATQSIWLTGITATPPNREIQKTAIGATESVHWLYVNRVEEAVLNAKEEGFQVWGVEQTDQSVLLQDFTIPSGKLALVFGNEVSGISDAILPLLDGCIEIPQVGTKHSLNVSVCGGIVLWDVFRRQDGKIG